MQILKYQTVIIGSGFAGRTVADKLSKGSYLIVERGEDRDYGQMYARFEEKMRATGIFMLRRIMPTEVISLERATAIVTLELFEVLDGARRHFQLVGEHASLFT
ncbi:hypothetical protein GPU89_20530 [Burkholderia cepacia]|nr:hypothetical protein [Burkholderia cepacia]